MNNTWDFVFWVSAIISAIIVVGFLVLEAWWFFVEMPRFRRTYLADMKTRYPEHYHDSFWPRRWQDKLYDRLFSD